MKGQYDSQGKEKKISLNKHGIAPKNVTLCTILYVLYMVYIYMYLNV